MEDSIQVFVFRNDQIRVHIDSSGEPWWVAKDVCKVLGLENNRQALSRIGDNRKGVIVVDTLGGRQNLLIVNEPGLYRLIFTSRKPEAEAFQEWVYSEVIPSIRRTGRYAIGKIDPDSITRTDLAKMVLQAENERAALAQVNRRQTQLIDIIKPAADFALSTLKIHGDTAQDIRVWAKELNCGLGPNQLTRWLREHGYLYYYQGDNVPAQKYLNRGWFVTQLQVFEQTNPYTGTVVRKARTKTRITLLGMAEMTKILREAGFVKNCGPLAKLD